MAQDGRTGACCPRCRAPVPELSDLCESCGLPQPPPEGAGDCFEFLGIPRSMRLDEEDLQRKFHSRSRRLHPDRFASAGGEALRNSEARSALLNKAYRILKDPEDRVRHLLEIERASLGLGDSAGNAKNVPSELAEEYFEMQESLAGGGPQALEKLKARLADFQDANRARLEELADRWDQDAGNSRRLPETFEGRKVFVRDLESALQLRNYLFRMEEDLGRAGVRERK